jgi:pimeloyl-ACP methyl ester carboxylesterase
MAGSADNAPHERCRFLGVDSVVLAAETAGEPGYPSVILLHGGGQTRHSWSGSMRGLVDAGYHVVNYDARGHGDSGWSADGVYSFKLGAMDLRKIIAVTQAPFALVGASMGGLVSLQALADAVGPSALILVDIVLHPAAQGIERIRDFMASRPDGFATLEEAVDAVQSYNPHRPRSQSSNGLLRNLRKRQGRLYWHWDPRIVSHDLTVDRRAREDLIARLRAVKIHSVPILLIVGEQSDVVNDANIEELREIFPQLEVSRVPGAGHMVVGDSHDDFNSIIARFLARHMPAAISQL